MVSTDHPFLMLDCIRETQLAQGGQLNAIETRMDRMIVIMQKKRRRQSPWLAIWNGLFRPGEQGGLKWLITVMVLAYLWRGGDIGSAIGFLNSPWKITPADARAAPTKTPAITLGNRISKMMVS